MYALQKTPARKRSLDSYLEWVCYSLLFWEENMNF